MAGPSQAKNPDRHAVKQRQREIAAHLAAYGLARGPRRLLRAASVGGEADYGRRLSHALAALGPVFAAFGHYLATRVDLLPVEDCLALAAIPDQAPAMPAALVWELIEQETKCAPAQLFAAFDEAPCAARLLSQSHHARLANGTPVTVRIRRGATEADFERDLAMLPLLQAALDSGRADEFPLASVVADFRRAWREEHDFARVAELMSEYRRETEQCAWLRTPLVHRQLCTARLLVSERLPGVSLAELTAQSGADELANTAADAAGMETRHLASRLCQLWLEQALAGQLFPRALRAAELVLLPDQQIAFTGGGWARLPAEAQANLGAYLIAASTQDYERACTCLLRETRSGARGDHEEALREQALRHQLRQVVPFRDGAWERRGGSETLSEHLFLHCRLAAAHGYHLRGRAQDFFGGLFLLVASAQPLAPAHDPLLEGLEDWRLNAALAQFRDLFGFRQIGNSADKYAALLLALPQRLDQALTLSAEGSAGPKRDSTASNAPRPRTAVVALALLLLLATVVALATHFAVAGGGGWVEKAGAILFVAIGALLLRAVK